MLRKKNRRIAFKGNSVIELSTCCVSQYELYKMFDSFENQVYCHRSVVYVLRCDHWCNNAAQKTIERPAITNRRSFHLWHIQNSDCMLVNCSQLCSYLFLVSCTRAVHLNEKYTYRRSIIAIIFSIFSKYFHILYSLCTWHSFVLDQPTVN